MPVLRGRHRASWHGMRVALPARETGTEEGGVANGALPRLQSEPESEHLEAGAAGLGSCQDRPEGTSGQGWPRF